MSGELTLLAMMSALKRSSVKYKLHRPYSRVIIFVELRSHRNRNQTLQQCIPDNFSNNWNSIHLQKCEVNEFLKFGYYSYDTNPMLGSTGRWVW